VRGFDISILWWALVAFAGGWVLAKTRFGNWLTAIGGDLERARRAGVPIERVKVILFMSTALAAAFVGALQAVQYTTADATAGQGFVFQAPIVAVIGGVLLTGGHGTVFGVVVGTIIYGIASAGMFYTGWDPDFAQVFIGVLMVVAVLTYGYVRKTALTSMRPSE
jgi:simple sugar transport system permease protein